MISVELRVAHRMPKYRDSSDEAGLQLLPVVDKSLQGESSKGHEADERDGEHLLS